jgi:hypothetical protein
MDALSTVQGSGTKGGTILARDEQLVILHADDGNTLDGDAAGVGVANETSDALQVSRLLEGVAHCGRCRQTRAFRGIGHQRLGVARRISRGQDRPRGREDPSALSQVNPRRSVHPGPGPGFARIDS